MIYVNLMMTYVIITTAGYKKSTAIIEQLQSI